MSSEMIVVSKRSEMRVVVVVSGKLWSDPIL